MTLSLPSTRQSWSVMSFTSTLYLCPVLDLLLSDIPAELQPEIRLGLQEALVNAAKHGNGLDPAKVIMVHFSVTKEGYSWLICDQGSGFAPACQCTHSHPRVDLPPEEAENGRGLCILHQIFDRVHWNREGTQLKLAKHIKRNKLQLMWS